MQLEYCIREMKREDLEQVTALEAACFSIPWKYRDFEETLTNKNRFYFVADTKIEMCPSVKEQFSTYDNNSNILMANMNLTESNIIGGCMLTNISGEGDISNVAVYEKYRKHNIATSILKAVIAFGMTHFDIKAFTLEVRSQNAPAIRLYQKLGFVTEGIRRNFYDKPKDDALIMWRR